MVASLSSGQSFCANNYGPKENSLSKRIFPEGMENHDVSTPVKSATDREVKGRALCNVTQQRVDEDQITRRGSCDKKTGPDTAEWTPPDGGYGWVIVGCAFMLMFLFASYSQIGVFLLELEEYFQVSKTTISWVNTAHTVTGRLLGILIGPFLHQVGSRWMALVGVVLLSSGYFTSSFLNDIPLLFITFGVMASFGCGCLYTIAQVIVQQYFTTKRSLVGGVAMTGISVGSFAWAPLAQTLKERFGWKTTFQIESVIFLVIGAVVLIFLKPAGTNTFCQPFWRKEKKSKSDQQTAVLNTSVKNKCCGLPKVCDLSLLRNPILAMYWTGMCFMSIGYLANSIYMPVRGELMGFNSSISAWQTSVMGITGGIATAVFAAVGNIPGVNRMLMCTVGILISTVQCFASTFIKSSTLLLVNAGILGLMSGVYSSVAFVNAVDVAGVDKVALAGGIHAAMFGIGHLVLHPITGALLDNTGNPQAPFYLATASWVLATICVGLSLLIRNRKKSTSYGMEETTGSESAFKIERTVHVWQRKEKTEDNGAGDADMFIIHF